MASDVLYYIGIDGGGTKTEGVLTDAEGRVLCAEKTGPSNPNDIGLNAAVSTITELVRRLMEKGGVSPAQVSVFGGIAGALAVKDRLTEAVSHALGGVACISVDSDVINLLAADVPTGEGACVICGTGSVCFLRTKKALRRIGGWGYLLDSAGSGYDIGRMALETALKACDGRGDETYRPLLSAITAHLGASPDSLIGKIYEGGKPYIAACAPVVFDLAKQGDPVADRILNVNAEALAACVTAALRKTQPDAPVTVILGGSINVKESPAWTERIRAHLTTDIEVLTHFLVAEAPPVFGAVAEARALTITDRAEGFGTFRRVFMENYTLYAIERT